MIRWILVAVALGSFLVYGRAIRHLFSREFGIDARMRVMQWCGTCAALIHLWALSRVDAIPPARGLASLLAYAVGLAVFRAACHATRERPLTLAFSPDTPQRLVAAGIYRTIRHPFYSAYGATWLAGFIAAPTWSTLTSAYVMWTLYGHAAREEERKFDRSALAQDYRQYRLGTGRFWPRVRRRAEPTKTPRMFESSR